MVISIHTSIKDYYLEVSRGNIPGIIAVHKFGFTSNADSGVETDVWDRANPTDDQDIWLAPTAARTHQIVSSSTDDDGDPAGIGAQTIRVWGLTGWNAVEVSEDLTMNGTTNVPTANAYVIIHRLRILLWGASGPNVGAITATADTDTTVTAMILAGIGQTRMAVYGFPSIQKLYLSNIAASIDQGSASGVKANIRIMENPIPDVLTTKFIRGRTFGLDDTGTSEFSREFKPYLEFEGPHIMKLEVLADSVNSQISGAFEGLLVNN